MRHEAVADVFTSQTGSPVRRAGSESTKDISLKNADGSSSRRGSELGPVLPLSHSATAGTSLSVKQAYLSRRSFEYLWYALSIVVAVSYLGFYRVARIGREHHEELKVNLKPPWGIYRWLGSKGVDVADEQWYFFVVALPPTTPYLIVFLLVSRLLRRRIHSTSSGTVHRMPDATPEGGWGGGSSNNNSSTGFSTSPTRRLLHSSGGSPRADSGKQGELLIIRKDVSPLHILHIFSGMFIALCISGPGFLFGVGLMLLNFYGVAPLYKRFSFRVCMTVMWVSQVAILFLNFHAKGYKFAWLGLSFLDNLWTPLIHWNTQYNMTMLRIISFNNDLWESVSRGEEARAKSMAKHAHTCVACAQMREQYRHEAASLPPEALTCYKCRTECSRRVEEYTLSAYLGYLFYLPLFMAGPLSSFNAYVSYQHHPARSMGRSAVRRYGIKFLSHALLLVTMMHYAPIMAILLTPAASHTSSAAAAVVKTAATKAVEAGIAAAGGSKSGAIPPLSMANRTVESYFVATTGALSVMEQMTFSEKACLFFLTLAFLWAKFDVIWRFFRFVALLDGFDPPEDMPFCFANTLNIQCFWRDWHASFNLWIVRYMYIPMGGNRHKFITIFPIFFFIAIWHDIEMRMLVWALFICIGFIPEIVVTTFFFSKTNPFVQRIRRSPLLWRYTRIVGTLLSMGLLGVANVIGFSIGTPGSKERASKIYNEMSLWFMVGAPYYLLCAAVVSTQDRDQRAYQHQQLKIKYGLQ